MLNKHESVEKEKPQSNSKKNGVVKNGNGVNGHTLMDFSKIKTGGKFLTNVVGSEKVFCKELFSEEEKMIYEAMKDFATNELLPLSQNELIQSSITKEITETTTAINDAVINNCLVD